MISLIEKNFEELCLKQLIMHESVIISTMADTREHCFISLHRDGAVGKGRISGIRTHITTCACLRDLKLFRNL